MQTKNITLNNHFNTKYVKEEISSCFILPSVKTTDLYLWTSPSTLAEAEDTFCHSKWKIRNAKKVTIIVYTVTFNAISNLEKYLPEAALANQRIKEGQQVRWKRECYGLHGQSTRPSLSIVLQKTTSISKLFSQRSTELIKNSETSFKFFYFLIQLL